MDIGSIAALTTSLQSAVEIAKAIMGLRDASAIQGKVIELQGVIMSAQASALSAQAEQFTLMNTVRNLEAKMAQMENWNAERQRYELKAVFPGAFAYVVKPELQGTEPLHWLCATCYHNGKKSILQDFARMPNDKTWELFKCPSCAAVVKVHYTVSPDRPYAPSPGSSASRAT